MDISKEKAQKLFEASNSKTEFAKKLGFDYYGGHSRNVVVDLIEKYNLETEFDRGKKNRKYPRKQKECPVCGNLFEAKIGHPKERTTCSYSCANSCFNRGNTEEAKKKKSESLKKYYKENEHFLNGMSAREIFDEYGFNINNGSHKSIQNSKNEKTKDNKNRHFPKCKIHSYKKCEVCGDLFVRANAKQKKTGFGFERKTCSKSCSIEASVGERTYQNGSRSPEYYYNENTGEEVLLESSWEVEVAEKLDNLDIRWTRPDPIDWKSENGDKHKYYPDFFLPAHNLYLDPKNPYCMERDKEKMKKISEKVDIVFGSLEKVKSCVDDL